MTATARRKTTIVFAGDVGGTQEYEAAYNATSPATTQLQVLASGNNIITIPAGATCLTIVKPSDNTVVLALKGYSGEAVGTGSFPLHPTDTDSISISPDSTTVVISADGAVTVRLVWS